MLAHNNTYPAACADAYDEKPPPRSLLLDVLEESLAFYEDASARHIKAHQEAFDKAHAVRALIDRSVAQQREDSEPMNRGKEHGELVNRICNRIGTLDRVMVMKNPQGVASPRGSKHYYKYGLGNGSADIVACVDGLFLALEVKTGDAVLSTEQQLWRNAFMACGGIYREVRAVEDAEAAVEEARGRR